MRPSASIPGAGWSFDSSPSVGSFAATEGGIKGGHPPPGSLKMAQECPVIVAGSRHPDSSGAAEIVCRGQNVSHFGQLPGGRSSTTKVWNGSALWEQISATGPDCGKLIKILNKNGRRKGPGSLPGAAALSRRRSRRWLWVLDRGGHRLPSIRSTEGMASARVSRAKIANIELSWRSSARSRFSIRFRIHRWRPGQLRPDLTLRPERGNVRPTGRGSRCALHWLFRPRYRPALSAAHTKDSFRLPDSGRRWPSRN
jgi:hypothetical protein